MMVSLSNGLMVARSIYVIISLISSVDSKAVWKAWEYPIRRSSLPYSETIAFPSGR